MLTRSKKLVALALALCASLFACLYLIVQFFSIDRSTRVFWSADSGIPVPARFSYVLFPKSTTVELLDGSGSPTHQFLDRALVCDETELTKQSIGVFIWQGESFVSSAELTCVPPEKPEALIKKWKAAVSSWGSDTDWPDVDVKFAAVSDQDYLVTFTRKSRAGDIEQFQYVVGSNAATVPKLWTVRLSKAVAFGGGR
jgi:hypothetical protein